jgi:arabinofuranosyltransferase
VTGRLPSRRVLSFILVALFSLFPVWAAAHNLAFRNDDTYITLTYAKSLAAGNGWRYNGGPEALGTTTPLFAILMALLARLLPAIPLEYLAVVFSTLCWLALSWLLFLGHHSFGVTRVAGTLLALVTLVQGGWWLAALGMEGSFLIFGLLLVVWFSARGQALSSGALSAGLFLVRPEGVAMAPLAALWLVWHQRDRWPQRLARFGLGAIAPLLLWGAYAWLTFGSILPNSATAKAAQGAFWPGSAFVERLVREWLPAYAAAYGPSSLISLLWPLVILGLLYTIHRGSPLLLVAAWTLLFVAGYAVLRAPGYWWYMLPVLVALQLFAALALAALLESRLRVLAGAGIALTLLFMTLTFHHGIQAVQSSRGDPRATAYLSIATWLRENTAADSSVAFVEIGYLGYYSGRYIVDLVGLTDPALTERGARLDMQGNFWYAEPDYLLYSSTFDWLLGDIVRDERFLAEYREVVRFTDDLPAPLVLYERVPTPPAGG